jgi:hypothetical protein
MNKGAFKSVITSYKSQLALLHPFHSYMKRKEIIYHDVGFYHVWIMLLSYSVDEGQFMLISLCWYFLLCQKINENTN